MLTERYVAREASSRIMCHAVITNCFNMFTQSVIYNNTSQSSTLHTPLIQYTCRATLFHLREMIKGEGEDGGFSPWSQCQ